VRSIDKGDLEYRINSLVAMVGACYEAAMASSVEPSDLAAVLVRAPTRALPLRGLLAASCTVVSWASAFVALRIALRSFPPQEVAVLRFVSAGAALAIVALVAKLPLPRRADVPRFAALGLVGHALYNLALARGQAQVPAATAAFLIASAPIWMLVIAALLGQERPTLAGVAGTLLSLVGVGLIAVGRGGSLVLDRAALVVLAAAVMQASYSMALRPLLARYSALQVSAMTALAALLWLAPFAPRALAHAVRAPWPHVLAAGFMGIVPTALGYSTWSAAMKHLSPSAAGSFLYLVPAVVVVMAWAVLGEVPAALTVAGGALVVTGVVVVQRVGRAVATPRR
jgi:drug/metabolite transporter (DMT)-like permease